jgi:hypothetical protein
MSDKETTGLSSQKSTRVSKNEPSSTENIHEQTPQIPFSPSHIAYLQRTIGNQATIRLMRQQANPTPQQPTPSEIKQNPDDEAIQRAVGYEFQTNWGVAYKKGFSRKKFSKGDIVRPYEGFNLTADDAGTELGAELEWVVDPPLPETMKAPDVFDLFHRLVSIASQMATYDSKDEVDLGQIMGDERMKDVKAYPKIKGADAGKDMKANPQVTGGVRLDRIIDVFSEAITLNDPSKAKAPHEKHGFENTLSVLMAEANNVLGYIATQTKKAKHPVGTGTLAGQPFSKSLQGLAAMALAYMSQARRGFNGGAYPYVKAVTILLARTDFSAMFQMLPDEERNYYSANHAKFSEAILGVIGSFTGKGADPMFPKGFHNVPNEPKKGIWQMPLTLDQWLTSIPQGTDLLSTFRQPAQKDKFESLGALGAKTDKVRTGDDNGSLNAPVFEFRKVKQQMPVAEWGVFGRSVFDYLEMLNKGETEKEQKEREDEEALATEYEEYMRSREDEI